MKKMWKVLIAVICAIVILVVIFVVVTGMKKKTTSETKRTDSGRIDRGEGRLSEYSYSVGGGMEGGGSRITVKAYDETRAVVSRESQEWHGAKPVVDEYLVDISILDDIEAVFDKYDMKKWHQKTFTDMFVSDGESYSYSFRFEGRNSVYFSSQIYPPEYSEKLAEFSEIIKKYEENREKIPLFSGR